MAKKLYVREDHPPTTFEWLDPNESDDPLMVSVYIPFSEVEFVGTPTYLADRFMEIALTLASAAEANPPGAQRSIDASLSTAAPSTP